MTSSANLSRRSFLVTSGLVAGALVIGVNALESGKAAAATSSKMSAWLEIGADGVPILRTTKLSAGNGTNASLVMFLCEELDYDPLSVRIELADITRDAGKEPVYSPQSGFVTWFAGRAGGLREAIQQAGASGRERLRMAAARKWDIAVSEVVCQAGEVLHSGSGRSLNYGELAAEAASIVLAEEPAIKPPAEWKLMGKRSIRQPNTGLKVDGSGIYGIDVQVPGMLYAAVLQAPVQGARLRSFNSGTIRSMPGVKHVVFLGPEMDKSTPTTTLSGLRSAIAVVSDHYWTAKQAVDAIVAEWDEADAANVSSETIRADFLEKLDDTSAIARTTGDFDRALNDAVKTLQADYEVPYQEHAPMEPLNATAHYTPHGLDLWVPTQHLGIAQQVAAEQSGFTLDKIRFHEVMVGGQFGRRNPNDETRQAIAISKAIRKPVKLIWTREEAVRQGKYRPYAITRFIAGLGNDGFPTAWFVRQAGHSYDRQLNPKFNDFDVINMRPITVETEYAIDNTRLEYHVMMTHIAVNSFRGSGAAFQVESFVDEMAHAGGIDPVEMRRWLLRKAKDPAWLRVLDEVTKQADWGKSLPKGRAQGCAINLDHGTICGQVADVSVSRAGEVVVHSIDVAFDVGSVINPDGVRAQMEGGVLFGLSNTLREEITIERGRVLQSNFHDYPVLRISEIPEVRVHFGANSGGSKCEPCGETPVPPVAPAVCNAIFRATGKRVRSLPLSKHDLSWA